VGMRERATMVGGMLTIDSAPGDGTTVRVTVPALNPEGGDA
jgi:two-component system sensor histidine kinase NreB